MFPWVDGTSAGEADPRALLECMAARGVAAVNIVPDRNWNFKRPEESAAKQAKLAEFVSVAGSMGLPINTGTEMNRLGQPFVDDLAGPALAPHAEAFRRGARIMVGHSILLRYAGRSFIDDPKDPLFEQCRRPPPLAEPAAADAARSGPRARSLPHSRFRERRPLAVAAAAALVPAPARGYFSTKAEAKMAKLLHEIEWGEPLLNMGRRPTRTLCRS